MSAHRRFGKGTTSFKSANWQARCTEQSLQMIHNTLPYIACGKSLLLDYGKFVKGPNLFAEQLAMLIGIDADAVRRCTSKIYSNNKDFKRRDFDEYHVNVFFSRRPSLWPYLSGEAPFPPPNITRHRHKPTS